MDYEKKYKEALERAKSAIKECGYNNGRIAMIETIFPELKESEDERIRRCIYNYINVTLDENESAEKEKWLVWLEKQCKEEQCESEEKYSVWIDGLEMNDNYLTKKEAMELAIGYKKDGYNNVKIELINC